MVAVFVRLKWALTTGRIRTASPPARAATILGLVAGLLLSGGIAAGLIGLRTRPDLSVPVVGLLFTVQFVAWMLAPLIAFGVDETVDPRRFALLPLTPAALQRGLLASSLVGYLPLFNMVALAGAAVALSPRWTVLPVAVLCCAMQMITCVIFSRAASTSMAALMSSRRGRDLGMAAGLALVVLYVVASLLLGAPGNRVGETGALTTASAVLWGPPGSWAAVPAAAAGGDAVRLGLAVATAVPFAAAGWWWWRAALRRSLCTMPSATAGSSPARAGDLGRAVADGLWGAARVVAARDVRLAWRDPLRRLPWLMVALFAIGWPFLVQGRGGLFAVLLGALMVGAQSANHLGVEGSGIWLHLVTFADRARARGELLGHALASAVPGTALIAVGLAVQVAFRGNAALLPAAAGVCLSGMLGALGGSSVISAAVPYAMPQSRTSVFASSIAGQKGRAAGASLSVLGIGMATALPAIAAAAAAVTVHPAWGWLSVAAALLCGAPVAIVLAAAGARRYLARAPEIFAIVSAGDRA